MAINLDERYPGRANGKTLSYPQGSFKNRTSPTAKDGTYLEQDWANDQLAFFQSLIKDAGMTANGVVDTVQASQYFNALIKVVANRFAPLESAALTGVPTAPTPGQGDNSTKIATTAFVARVLGSYPMMVSIAAVPTYNAGPLMIAEAGEMWLWTSTAYYTGYRSPLCGRPLLGHTPNPFVNEVDAVGGLLSKAAYPALWGYAQEAGLVVSQAVWTANIGAHYFVDVNSTQFRVPDLRDMHMRFTGTSAEGGPRALGTKQLDASQRLQGVLGAPQEIGVNGVFAALPGTTTQFAASPTSAQSFTQIQMDTARTSRVSSETRGVNVAFHPRIHI